MKSLYFCVLLACLSFDNPCFGQSIYERIPDNGRRGSVLLLGCHGTNIKGFGSATLFFAPTSTNGDEGRIVCAVTALHNLKDKETGEMFDSLYLKIGMPPEAKPRYVKVPLKHDEPKSYWVSPSGLDLAVIPLPPEVIDGSDMGTLTEGNIITPEKIEQADIVPGLVVQVLCLQPEYWNYPTDYLMPQTIPTIRIGHISRLGFYKDSTGLHVRPHIIDVHSSPGNSGAMVLAWVPRKDVSMAEPMFLGVVKGFFPETGSYEQYQIPLSQTSQKTADLVLVSAEGATNKFGLAPIWWTGSECMRHGVSFS